jgi:hypothetical protein
VTFNPETVIRGKPRALLVIYQTKTGQRVVRCKICHLGFSGERVGRRALAHVKAAHGKAIADAIAKNKESVL